MNFEVDIKLPFRTSGITVCGDGEVYIVAQESAYGDITVSLELEELREMLKQAEAHKAAYDAFIANDYEVIVMPEVGNSVKPNWGRNAGKWGVVDEIDSEHLAVLINFGGQVTLPDGYKAPDRYWSSIKKIEVQKDHTK